MRGPRRDRGAARWGRWFREGAPALTTTFSSVGGSATRRHRHTGGRPIRSVAALCGGDMLPHAPPPEHHPGVRTPWSAGGRLANGPPPRAPSGAEHRQTGYFVRNRGDRRSVIGGHGCTSRRDADFGAFDAWTIAGDGEQLLRERMHSTHLHHVLCCAGAAAARRAARCSSRHQPVAQRISSASQARACARISPPSLSSRGAVRGARGGVTRCTRTRLHYILGRGLLLLVYALRPDPLRHPPHSAASPFATSPPSVCARCLLERCVVCCSTPTSSTTSTSSG